MTEQLVNDQTKTDDLSDDDEVSFKYNSLSSRDLDDDNTVVFLLDPLDDNELLTIGSSRNSGNRQVRNDNDFQRVSVVADKLNLATRQS